ncbi:MAG TPA: InlB B-repeat-containing protein, partial [Gemmataceae bacterium]|nr:InlB B-repeat-containing protein [Gemmataceae bacterium]
MAPTPADAAEYCVHAAADPCTGQIDKGNDLQAALDAAAADEADDTIHLGPGEYLAPTGQAFDYDAPFLGPTGGELHIVGSGSGSGGTLLKADDGNIVYTLSIQSQAKTLVENLAIAVPNGSHGGQNVGVAMVGSAGSQTSIHVLDGVAIKFPANPSVGSGPLVGAYLQNATFRNGTATGPVPSSVPMTGVSSAGNDLVEDATIKAGTAVYMQSEGTARRIDATGDKGFELVSHSGAGEFTVEDVLWRPPTGETGIRGLDASCGSLAGIQVTLRNATFWATPGSGGSTSISCAPASSHAHLDIDSSILGGGGKAILIGTGPDVTVGVSYSNFDPATIQAADPADVQQGSGNTNLTPGFVGATDFHLGSGSLLLDKGNPAALASGESTTDLAGNPRVVQACTAPPARRDMGAYEYQTPPPGTCDGTDNVTVTFDSAGGSSVAPATVPLGTAVTKPTNPTRSGYTFQGWFTA